MRLDKVFLLFMCFCLCFLAACSGIGQKQLGAGQNNTHHNETSISGPIDDLEEYHIKVLEPLGVNENRSDEKNFRMIKTGIFSEVMHNTSGKVFLYQIGRDRLLRFDSFSTAKGQELYVYLAREFDIESKEDIDKGYINLGKLKNEEGMQEYEIPADVILDDYNSVVVYSWRHGIVFGSADLY